MSQSNNNNGNPIVAGNPLIIISTPSGSAEVPLKPRWTPPNPVILQMKFQKELAQNTKKYLVFKGMRKFAYSTDFSITFENHSLPQMRNRNNAKATEYKNWIYTKLVIPVKSDSQLFQVTGAKTGNKRVGIEIPSTLDWEVSVPNYIPDDAKVLLKNHLIKHFTRIFSILVQQEINKTGKKKIYTVSFQTELNTNKINYVSLQPADGQYEPVDVSTKKEPTNNKYMILLTNKNYYFTDDAADKDNAVTIDIKNGTVDRLFGDQDAKKDSDVPF